MEVGPIFRALINHRTRFWLIVAEIALTLAVVANCVNIIADQRAKMARPTGLDEAGILVVDSEPFAPEFQDPAYVRSAYDEDLRRLRALPGVRAATGMHAIPLSGGGSATDRRNADGDGEVIAVPYYVVGPDALETLGVELVAGRGFTAEDFATPGEDDTDSRPPEITIVTQEVANLLFPDGGALGGRITGRGEGGPAQTIVGVIRRMHCSWPQSSLVERVALFPGMPATSRRARYLVRAEPGMVDSLYASLEEELVRVNEGRLVRVQTLAEEKADTYLDLIAMNQLLAGLSVLLVVVTCLGIVGLTSFSVTERRREIGTRRALGASRTAIVRYFLVESTVMTACGLALGLVLTYSLNFALAHFAETPRIGFLHVGVGMLALWAAGLMAALGPAARGSAVAPVIATRTV